MKNRLIKESLKLNISTLNKELEVKTQEMVDYFIQTQLEKTDTTSKFTDIGKLCVNIKVLQDAYFNLTKDEKSELCKSDSARVLNNKSELTFDTVDLSTPELEERFKKNVINEMELHNLKLKIKEKDEAIKEFAKSLTPYIIENINQISGRE